MNAAIMDILTAVFIGIGLAMDALAVSLCKGMAMRHPSVRSVLTVGLWFGAFQMMMPIIGYYLGSSFYTYIEDYDHWIAFMLLAVIGVNMMREAVSGEDEGVDGGIGFRTMLILAVATSIDALAVGISLAMTGDGILASAAVIGVITFLISAFGVKAGSVFGDRFGSKAELFGGIVLILIGLKILLEHSGFL